MVTVNNVCMQMIIASFPVHSASNLASLENTIHVFILVKKKKYIYAFLFHSIIQDNK